MIKGLLLQASGDGGGFFSGQMILLIGIVVVFYFFMIRPQQKKQKQQKKFLENIKKGDSVVTIGGIHGKVVAVEDQKVILDIDRGTKITLNKSAVSLDATEPANVKK